jgi:acetylornithine/succinyldiaminopimelate/putrescine aminotransferase/predicted amino acid dehydrogenase
VLNPTLRRLLDHCGFDRTFVRGEGSWLTDAHGRRFLDFYAQYGAAVLGHNPSLLTGVLVQALQAHEPALVQPYRAPHAEALAQALVAATGLHRCIFTSTGAETVEAALKLVRSRSSRPLVVAAHGAYHGKTLGALAATGQPQYQEGFGPLPPGFVHVRFGDADELAALLSEHAPQIAGVLLEPVQGERGVIVPPPGYLRRVRELCTQHGVALILDEIQTGLGRTGALLCATHEGVRPDVLLLSKALGGGLFPLGALLVDQALWDDRFALRHSSTFANHNLACRVGRAVLEELTRGGLLDEVARKGRLLGALLDELAARRADVVVAVRRAGLLAAIELRPPGEGCGLLLSYLKHQGLYAYAAAQLLAERHGVLVLPTLGGGEILRLAPPLSVSECEIRAALSGLDDVLATLERRDAAAVARALGATQPRHAEPSARPSRLTLPPPPRIRDGRSRYAFLVHYTDLRDVITTDPALARLGPDELKSFVGWAAHLPPGVVLHGPRLRSLFGAEVDGYILALSLLPEQMLRCGRRRVRAAIEQAVDLAARLGASIVGLGGFTTPYSSRGLDVRGRGPGITTGNALTAVMAVQALQKALQQSDLPRVPLRARALSEATVAIVGARGSVGALCARLLARERPARLWPIGHAGSDQQRLRALADEISWGAGTVEVETNLGPLSRCSVVVSASGAGRPVLDGAVLAPGTLIADMARPFDASPALRARRDLLVLDGGLVALPDPSLRFGTGNLQGLPDGVQLACLSETLLLALAGHRGDFSIGDDITIEQADHIAALAAQHGFELASLSLAGSPAGPAAASAEAVA